MALPQGYLGEEHEQTRRVDGPAGEGGQSSQTIRQRCPQPARSPSQGTSPDCYSFQSTTKKDSQSCFLPKMVLIKDLRTDKMHSSFFISLKLDSSRIKKCLEEIKIMIRKQKIGEHYIGTQP